MESPAALFPLARAAVTSALAVEPEQREAITTLACIEAVFDWNWTAAEQRFQHAITLNPQYGTAHHWYASNVLIPLGRFPEARQQIEQAAVNDSLAHRSQIMTGLIAWYERDTARAIHNIAGRLKWMDRGRWGTTFSARQCEQAVPVLQAVNSLERALEFFHPAAWRSKRPLRVRSAVANRRGVAGSNAAGAAAKSETQYVSPVLLAQVLLGLDRNDEAVAELRRASPAESDGSGLAQGAARPFDPGSQRRSGCRRFSRASGSAEPFLHHKLRALTRVPAAAAGRGVQYGDPPTQNPQQNRRTHLCTRPSISASANDCLSPLLLILIALIVAAFSGLEKLRYVDALWFKCLS